MSLPEDMHAPFVAFGQRCVDVCDTISKRY
jgi:hypothetical protein